MRQLTFIFLTGPPSAGKSTICDALEADVAVLRCDDDIMNRIFYLWPDAETRSFENQIGNPARWDHLRQEIDFDLIFRLFHTDWLCSQGFPEVVIAEGWIYAKQHWRSQVYDCIRNLPGVWSAFRLWVLRPSADRYFGNYTKKRMELPDTVASRLFFDMNQDERRRLTDGFLAEFDEKVLEPPSEEEHLLSHDEVHDLSEARTLLQGTLASHEASRTAQGDRRFATRR